MQAERPTGKHMDKQKHHEKQAEAGTHADKMYRSLFYIIIFILSISIFYILIFYIILSSC